LTKNNNIALLTLRYDWVIWRKGR